MATEDTEAEEQSPKGYALFQIEVTDRERYVNEYLPPTKETVEKYDGQVLVSSDDPLHLEGDWDFNQTVILEFPSVEDAKAWYNDEEYQEAKSVRFATTEANNGVIVPGIPPG